MKRTNSKALIMDFYSRNYRMSHLMVPLVKRYLFGSVFRKGATLLTALTLGSYLLGLVRDILLAKYFGASRTLDIYNASFILPDLMLNIFVAGALTAAFVPVFSHLMAAGENKKAEDVATTMLYSAPLIIIILSTPMFFLMPRLSAIVAPGIVGAERELLISMTRLLLLSPMIFALSNTLGNILISYDKFLGYGLSPLLYNLGIIAGIPLAGYFGPMGLAYGVLLGALFHLAVRVGAIAKSAFHSGAIKFKDKNFLKILKLMLPRMAGQPIEQAVFFVFTHLASTISIGAITVLSFARNFQSVPVSLFGISFSTAIFASLSRKAATGDKDGFVYQLKEASWALALTTGLSAFFFMFFGTDVVRLLLGRGQFGEADVIRTGQLLFFFAFAIPAESFIHLIARAFYALKDTWTPILITLPGLGLIIFLAKKLVPLFSLNALPISYALILSAEVLILFLILRRRVRNIS